MTEKSVSKIIIIIEDFNNPLSLIDRTRQKPSNDIELGNTMNKKNIVVVYGTVHLTIEKYIFSSFVHGT